MRHAARGPRRDERFRGALSKSGRGGERRGPGGRRDAHFHSTRSQGSLSFRKEVVRDDVQDAKHIYGGRTDRGQNYCLRKMKVERTKSLKKKQRRHEQQPRTREKREVLSILLSLFNILIEPGDLGSLLFALEIFYARAVSGSGFALTSRLAAATARASFRSEPSEHRLDQAAFTCDEKYCCKRLSSITRWCWLIAVFHGEPGSWVIFES